MAPGVVIREAYRRDVEKRSQNMNSLMEIEKKRETKLKSAKIEDGFYNIIGGQRSAAARKLSVLNPATAKSWQPLQISSPLYWTTR
jgi:hypothetical protein